MYGRFNTIGVRGMNEAIWPAALDLGDSTPLYRQLENIALSAIRSGALRPGDLLPSEGELCARYGLSRSTVRQAFALFLLIFVDDLVAGLPLSCMSTGMPRPLSTTVMLLSLWIVTSMWSQ